MYKLQCKNCGNIINMTEWQESKILTDLTEISNILNNITGQKFIEEDTLSYMNRYLKCCKNPNYWEVE